MEKRHIFAPVLSRMIGERIRINLKDNGVTIRGRLVAFDEKMNIVMEEAEEFFDGHPTFRYGSLIIRGSSILSIYSAESL